MTAPRAPRLALAAWVLVAVFATTHCARSEPEVAPQGPRPGIPTRDATLSARCAQAAEGLRALVVENANSLDLDARGAEALTTSLADIRAACSQDEQRRLLVDELGDWLGETPPG